MHYRYYMYSFIRFSAWDESNRSGIYTKCSLLAVLEQRRGICYFANISLGIAIDRISKWFLNATLHVDFLVVWRDIKCSEAKTP